MIEKNSRIDIKDLAVLLEKARSAVANEIAEMEKNILSVDTTLSLIGITQVKKSVALIEVKVTPQRGMGFD